MACCFSPAMAHSWSDSECRRPAHSAQMRQSGFHPYVHWPRRCGKRTAFHPVPVPDWYTGLHHHKNTLASRESFSRQKFFCTPAPLHPCSDTDCRRFFYLCGMANGVPGLIQRYRCPVSILIPASFGRHAISLAIVPSAPYSCHIAVISGVASADSGFPTLFLLHTT